MPLKRRASKKFRDFDLPVSFKMGEAGNKLRDALNVFSNQGRLETRFGRGRHKGLQSSAPWALPGSPAVHGGTVSCCAALSAWISGSSDS